MSWISSGQCLSSSVDKYANKHFSFIEYFGFSDKALGFPPGPISNSNASAADKFKTDRITARYIKVCIYIYTQVNCKQNSFQSCKPKGSFVHSTSQTKCPTQTSQDESEHCAKPFGEIAAVSWVQPLFLQYRRCQFRSENPYPCGS